MVTDTLLVLRLNANAQGVAVWRDGRGLLESISEACKAVRILHFISIHDAVIDFVADIIERAWIDTVSREVFQRFRMVKNFTCAVEMLLQIGMFDQLFGPIELLRQFL